MPAGAPPGLTPEFIPGVRQTLWRALRLRCPRCGGPRLFAGPFRMHECCSVCGLRYEREPGYFIGAIYINYAVTVGVAAGLVFLLDGIVGLTLTQQLVIGIGLGIVVPLVFFRHARSLWLAVDYLVTAADARAEWRRQRRRP